MLGPLLFELRSERDTACACGLASISKRPLRGGFGQGIVGARQELGSFR